jgi:aspartate dehydrogenase
MTVRLAAIGYGAMAQALETALARRGDGLRLNAVLTRSPTAEGPTRFASVADLIAARPQLVVECASHTAVRETVPPLLAAGIDVVVASIGAVRKLDAAAAAGNARLTVASGAIGGLDALRAARLAGLDTVIYEGRKPPVAWRGTPAETALDLDALTSEAVVFEGTAQVSATLYPKNANVTAAVALAGIGFERTRVKLIADPAARGNSHALTAEGAFGRFHITLANAALPGNPKTSWLAALSVEQEIRAHFSRLRL